MGNKFGFHSGVASAKGLKVGADKTVSTEIKQIKVISATVGPTQVNANTVSAQTFTVAGVTTDDVIFVKPGVSTIGLGPIYVSSANTVTITFINPTAAPITPVSTTWKFVAIRS